MKKKLLITISVIIILAISAVTLSACFAPDTLPQFVSKAATAEMITIENYDSEGNLTMKIEKRGIMTRTQNFDDAGNLVYDAYDVVENKKAVVYVKVATESWKNQVENLLEQLLNSITGIGEEPIKVTLTLNKWARFETYEIPEYVNNSVFKLLPFNILEIYECPKCVGKDYIENQFNKKYLEVDGKWYPVGIDGGADKLGKYYVYNEGFLEVFEKDGDKYYKSNSFELNCERLKLPEEAAELKK